MHSQLAGYILVFLQATVPVNQHTFYEKTEITEARYESIADDIAAVSIEAPLFEDDPDGVKTGLLLASIATFESFLNGDVDSCKRGGDIKNGVYQAWTLWQLHVNKNKVCGSRLAAARVAREMVRQSLKFCNKYPLLDRLAVYTDGVCKSNWKRSRFRMERAIKWVGAHPFED